MTPDKLRELADKLSIHDKDLLLGRCEGWGSWMFESGEYLCSLGLGTKRNGSIAFDTPLAAELTEYFQGTNPMTDTLVERIKQLIAERKHYFDVEGDGVDVVLRDCWATIDRITALTQALDEAREALDKQGRALAAWVNILEAHSKVVLGEEVATGDYLFARGPLREEVQASLEAQNDAASALTTIDKLTKGEG